MSTFGVSEQNINNKTMSTTVGNITIVGVPALGLCAPLTVNSVDGGANPENVTSDSLILVAGLGSHAAIFSDSTCSTPLANPTILANTNTTTFYFKDSTAESLTLTGTLASFGTANHPVTIFSPLASAFSMAPASGSLSNNAAPVVTATLPAGDAFETATLTIYSALGCGTPVGSAAIASGSQNVTLALTTNTTYTFYYEISNAGGTTACTSTTLTYSFDNVAPSIIVTTPNNAFAVSNLNQAAFPIAGTCSENGVAVVVTASGPASATASSSPTCTGGNFSTTLDLSTFNDGAETITISQTDTAGNNTTITRTGTKSTCQTTTTVVTTTGNTSYNVSANCKYVLVKAWGAGGGSGGGDPTYTAGSSSAPAGGGGFASSILPEAGQALTIVVGAGGGGGSQGNSNDNGAGGAGGGGSGIN